MCNSHLCAKCNVVVLDPLQLIIYIVLHMSFHAVFDVVIFYDVYLKLTIVMQPNSTQLLDVWSFNFLSTSIWADHCMCEYLTTDQNDVIAMCH